jgi:hypothetical protein
MNVADCRDDLLKNKTRSIAGYTVKAGDIMRVWVVNIVWGGHLCIEIEDPLDDNTLSTFSFGFAPLQKDLKYVMYSSTQGYVVTPDVILEKCLHQKKKEKLRLLHEHHLEQGQVSYVNDLFSSVPVEYYEQSTKHSADAFPQKQSYHLLVQNCASFILSVMGPSADIQCGLTIANIAIPILCRSNKNKTRPHSTSCTRRRFRGKKYKVQEKHVE